MSSARASIIVVFIGLLTACEAASEKAEKAETARTEPAKVDTAKIEPAQPEPTKPEPVPPPAEPLSFTLGARSFTAATALATRFNDQRRVVISSMPTTCEQLLAIPEQYQAGNVNFIVTTPWTIGTHSLASAEILDDDTREVTNIYPKGATIRIVAAPQNVGEVGKIELSVSASEGGAKGTIDVATCE